MTRYDFLDHADLLELGLMAANDPTLIERLLAPNDAEDAEDAERR